MKLIIFIFLSFFIISCTKEQKPPQSEGTKKDTVTEKPKTETKTTDDTPKNAEENKDNSISSLVYDTGKLPPGIKYSGKIIGSARWIDKNGENILIITETNDVELTGGNRSKELFGYHYIISGDETKLLWKINDFIKDCPLDLTLSYFDKSLSITDLDENGIAESSFLYRMSCKGDVSPDDMKLIMHEGETKYAIRGQMELTIAGEGTYGGDMKIDPSFDKAPEKFLDYARSRWKKYAVETVGE